MAVGPKKKMSGPVKVLIVIGLGVLAYGIGQTGKFATPMPWDQSKPAAVSTQH